MNRKIKILMTGAGAPGAAGIIRCLLSAEWVDLTIADADSEAVGRYLHPQFVSIPPASDPGFTEALLDICRHFQIQVLLPLVTRELFHLSVHRKRFLELGTRVLVSSAEAIGIANNKSLCYHYLAGKGIPVPRFRVVHDTESFIHAAFELGHPQRSFCFKPSVSNGSRGFRIVSDSINESELLFNQKPYQTYITYPHALKILSSQAFPELLVSEYLPGEEYSVDCLAHEGRMILAVPRIRTKMINGISVQGRFVHDEAIIHYCKQIIETIGLHGNIGIQVKRSETGEPLLLEINPRVQGTIVAGLGAGVNLPLLAVKQELDLTIAEEELAVKWGTRFSRYWSEIFY